MVISDLDSDFDIFMDDDQWPEHIDCSQNGDYLDVDRDEHQSDSDSSTSSG